MKNNLCEVGTSVPNHQFTWCQKCEYECLVKWKWVAELEFKFVSTLQTCVSKGYVLTFCKIQTFSESVRIRSAWASFKCQDKWGDFWIVIMDFWFLVSLILNNRHEFKSAEGSCLCLWQRGWIKGNEKSLFILDVYATLCRKVNSSWEYYEAT